MNLLLYIPEIFGLSIEVYFILSILGIPVFYIWRWILKKMIKEVRARQVTTWVVTLISTPIIYIGVFLVIFFAINYFPHRSFNKTAWLSDKEKRYEFSTEIINSKMLIGKTKAEVKDILGDDGNTDESDEWGYDIGYLPEIGNIDPSVLIIDFQNGKVTDVRQR